MIDKGIVEFLDAKTPPAVLKRLLALNNAHAKELSWLDAQKLASMISTAFLARRIGNIDAFILAFDQDADYQAENFQWFKSRYERFVYVDRIAVAAAARGHGLARRLYEHLFAAAIIPPVLVFIFGLSVLWIISGFKVKNR